MSEMNDGVVFSGEVVLETVSLDWFEMNVIGWDGDDTVYLFLRETVPPQLAAEDHVPLTAHVRVSSLGEPDIYRVIEQFLLMEHERIANLLNAGLSAVQENRGIVRYVMS